MEEVPERANLTENDEPKRTLNRDLTFSKFRWDTAAFLAIFRQQAFELVNVGDRFTVENNPNLVNVCALFNFLQNVTTIGDCYFPSVNGFVGRIAADVANAGYGLRDLVVAIVNSKPFQQR